MYYERISVAFPGWTLTEIRQMPHRERDHWAALIKWRLSAPS